MQTNYKPGAVNQRPVDLAVEKLNRLRLSEPGATLADTRKQGNTFNLTAGDFGRYVTSTDGTVLKGCPGTNVAGLTSNHRLTVDGVHFADTVELGAAASVVFNSCTFAKPITVKSGGKAMVTNSVFGTSANIQNAGIAANCCSANNIRKGPAHTNTTILFEVT